MWSFHCSFLIDSGCIIFPATVCDNTYRMLLTRETHPSVGVQSFTGDPSPKAPTLNHIVGLCGVATPYSKSHCQTIPCDLRPSGKQTLLSDVRLPPRKMAKAKPHFGRGKIFYYIGSREVGKNWDIGSREESGLLVQSICHSSSIKSIP